MEVIHRTFSAVGAFTLLEDTDDYILTWTRDNAFPTWPRFTRMELVRMAYRWAPHLRVDGAVASMREFVRDRFTEQWALVALEHLSG